MDWRIVWKYTLIVVLLANIAVAPIYFVEGIFVGIGAKVSESLLYEFIRLLIWSVTIVVISYGMALVATKVRNYLSNVIAVAIFSFFFSFVVFAATNKITLSDVVVELIVYSIAIPLGAVWGKTLKRRRNLM